MELLLGVPPSTLRRPVLLAGFGGWSDPGNAATIALRHLLGEMPGPPCAILNPSACYDFTVARPLSSRHENGQWMLEYPKVTFHAVYLADAPRDLLVMVGPEPHFRWPEIAPATAAFARRAGVEQVVTLGAYVGAVSHRAAPVSRRTLGADLERQLADFEVEESDYEGPTAFATALLHAGFAAGIPGVSLWVATPPYLQAGNPVAAAALLRQAQSVTGLPLEAARLQQSADSFLDEVDRALDEHPELAAQLKEMLEAVGADEEDEAEAEERERGVGRIRSDPDRPPPDAPPGLPTGKALVEAVEQYLRRGKKEPPA